MNSMNDSGVVAGLASGQTSHTHRLRGLAVTGFIAALAAMVATTLAAALAQAVVRDRRGDRLLLGRGHRHCRRSSPSAAGSSSVGIGSSSIVRRR